MTMTPIEKERFVSGYDAVSRVVIRAINWTNSPRISQMGKVVHNEALGGFVASDGYTVVTDKAQCFRQLVNQGQTPFPLPSEYPLQPYIAPLEAMPPFLINQIPSFKEKVTGITPSDMPLLLSELIGQKDFIYLSRALNLDQENYDHVNSGHFIRAFQDNVEAIPNGCNDLCIFDHLSFVRRNVFFKEAIFTVKYFGYAEQSLQDIGQRKIYPFLFKPDKPDIWFPDSQNYWNSSKILLCTDIQAVLNQNTCFNALLIDAGEMADLDWVLFRDRETCYPWDQDGNNAKDELKTLIRFLAESQKHESVSISVSIKRRYDDEKLLPMPEIIALVERYGLKLPEKLRDEGYVFDPDSHVNSDLPIWLDGGSALFCGMGCEMVQRILLRIYNAIPMEPQVALLHNGGKEEHYCPSMFGILCPSNKKEQRDELIKRMKANVYCIPENLEEDELKTELYRNKIKILFILYADQYSPKKLVTALNLCKNMEIPVGLFVDGEDGLIPEVMSLVSQSYFTVANSKSVIVKNMKTKCIERFTFSKENDKVISFPSNEAEIKKRMENKHDNNNQQS